MDSDKATEELASTGANVRLAKATMGAVSLPAHPSVVARIVGILDDPDLATDRLVTIISSDPVLASRVLKLANSPYFGFSGTISDLHKALSVLGPDSVKDLVLSVPVSKSDGLETRHNLFDDSLFWEHSVASAVCARMLAWEKGLDNHDSFFVAGLIHDIGRLVMSIYARGEYLDATSAALQEGKSVLEKERECLGIDHACVGAWLAGNWNFPDLLIEAVLFHHKPSDSSDTNRRFVSLIHFSDYVANTAGFRTFRQSVNPPVETQSLGVKSQEMNFPQDEITKYSEKLRKEMREAGPFLERVEPPESAGKPEKGKV